MDGKIVTCPWHGWQYDVTTGKVGQNPTVGWIATLWRFEEKIFCGCRIASRKILIVNKLY